MGDDYSTAMGILLAEAPQRGEVEHAVALLEDASAKGDGRASERCALFEAVGMMRPQSWERSLSLLQLAAEQGFRGAQEQLLLLSGGSAAPAISVAAPADLWSGVRASIAIERLLHPGDAAPLSDDPRIRAIKAFATPAECRWLIGVATNRIARATVFDRATGAQIHDPVRDNSYVGLRLGDMNVVTEVIRSRISAATRLPVQLFEPSQILHYSVGQQFRQHYDFLDPGNPAYREELARSGQRIATFLLYLNDDYSGGETTFPNIDVSFRGDSGDALFFANVRPDGSPHPDSLHAGLPPTSGEKWILSQWIRDRVAAA